MTRNYMPPEGTEECNKVVDIFLHGSDEQAENLWKQLGYANYNSFSRAMRVRGFYRGNPSIEITEPAPVGIKIPEIKIRKYKPVGRRKGDPETQVLLLGDHHAGEITPTYNPDVYRQRLGQVFKSTLVITESHRHSFPINDLVIIALGDMIHGENPHQGAGVESVNIGAISQIYELALPELLGLISSFRENFKTVKFYGVWGNHGRYSREAPRTSNWDNALYKAMSQAKLPAGVEIYLPETFCQIFTIKGFKFFCYHGDQINMSSGIPYFAQRRKVMSWHSTFGGFTYACQGHFHEDDILSVSSETTLFCNGALVSDDPFPLEKLGLSTVPIQRTFGVHERMGVTWTNRVIVDFNFLPRKYEEDK